MIVEAWERRDRETLPPFVVAGGAGLLAKAAASRGLTVPIEPVATLAEAWDVFDRALPVVMDLDCEWHPGTPDVQGARLAFASLAFATSLASGGEAAGLVTGPIAKSLLAEIGFAWPGQTEFVAHECGVAEDDAVMMLAGPQLRTIPLTVHVALSAVPGLLSVGRIVRRGRIAASALQTDFGIARPRVAVAALNPHAGEDGRMGSEDEQIIRPAVELLRAEGIRATGPHPADALFAPHARGTYDVALCMYHDQALIPLKALDFDNGVNVTLGLPIVRTSPDHGTAFDIAGKALANPGAMIAAIRMAAECAARRSADG